METYLGLEISDSAWYTVLSQMTSGHPSSLRKSYASMVNAGNKLKIVKLVGDEKKIAHDAHMAKLKETMERVANEL
jgi:hypothetical protein